MKKKCSEEEKRLNEGRRPLTLTELQTHHARAYRAFMDFTEAQTMFWELSIGPAGDIWAEDWPMDTRIQWVPEIGLWH